MYDWIKRVSVAAVFGLVMAVFVVYAEAGVVFYENEAGLVVSVEDVSAVLLYDTKEGEYLAGTKVGIVKYKEFSADVGAIGNYDNLDTVDLFVGISYALKAFAYKESFYSSAGIFASPGWLDKAPARFGIYLSATKQF